MKILDTLPEKIGLFEPFVPVKAPSGDSPLVACLILFGDNYTSFLRHGPMEFKKSV
jgi:hypothetical protein